MVEGALPEIKASLDESFGSGGWKFLGTGQDKGKHIFVYGKQFKNITELNDDGSKFSYRSWRQGLKKWHECTAHFTFPPQELSVPIEFVVEVPGTVVESNGTQSSNGMVTFNFTASSSRRTEQKFYVRSSSIALPLSGVLIFSGSTLALFSLGLILFWWVKQQKMRCLQCSALLEKGARFCGQGGTAVAGTLSKKEGSPWFAVGLLVVLLLLGFPGYVSYLALHQPQRKKQPVEESLRTALVLVQEIPGDEYGHQSRVYAQIAMALARAGKTEKSLETLAKIKVPEWRCRALCEAALAVAKGGNKEQAEGLLKEAFRVALQLQEEGFGALALSQVSATLSQLGRRQKSVQLAREALKSAKKLEPELIEELVPELLANLALVFSVESLALEPYCHGTLALVAATLAEARQTEQALQVVKRLRKEHPLFRVPALVTVAQAFARAREEAHANEIFQEALRLAEGMEEKAAATEAFTTLAQALAEVGRTEESPTVTKEALQAALQVADTSARDWYLLEASGVFARAGQKKKALQPVCETLHTV